MIRGAESVNMINKNRLYTYNKSIIKTDVTQIFTLDILLKFALTSAITLM